MENTLATTCVVTPAEGQVLSAFGDDIKILLGPKQTGGKFTMFLAETPPGGGPPPHVHTREDEWFFVMEGSAEFFRNGEWVAVPAGSAAYTPRGVPHSFRNAGDTTLRMLVHASPSGFETFFARCSEEFGKPGGPNMELVMGIMAEHGINPA